MKRCRHEMHASYDYGEGGWFVCDRPAGHDGSHGEIVKLKLPTNETYAVEWRRIEKAA